MKKRLGYALLFLSTPPGRRLTGILVGVALALGGLGTYVLVIPNPGGGTPVRTVTFGGPHATPTSTVELPKAALMDAAGVEDNLRSENPAGVSNAVLDRAQAYQDKLAANDQLPITSPDAAPSQRGCTTKLVQNFSSRRGVAPREFILHYTVSANRVGWSDVDAIAGLFDRPSFAASSNYVIDGEGHCDYIVRESDKAWTQAAANAFSISAEVINTGHEPVYIAPAGLHTLALVVSDALDRWKIPLQRGVVRNCIPVVPGITDHNSLGACGGGHHDITPYSVPQVIAAVKAFRASTSKPRPVLYKIVAYRGTKKSRTLVTTRPGLWVGRLSKRGFTRIYVVRPRA